MHLFIYDVYANVSAQLLLYPETSLRSLEEIYLIFAKGYYKNMSYVKAAQELPKLSVQDMEQQATQYGLAEANEFEKSSLEHIEEVNSMNT